MDKKPSSLPIGILEAPGNKVQISVLLADDHAIVCDGIKALLEAQPDITVIGMASDGREAVREAVGLRPDIVIMDIAMPELNGIEAAAQIRERSPSTRIIMLSMHSTTEHVYRALEAGAQGYLSKESTSTELVKAVRAVHSGKRFFGENIFSSAVEGSPQQTESPLQSLSQREREVLQLVVEGHSSAMIAQSLSLSPKTIETYRGRLMKKLGVRNLPDLVKFALQHGLTPPA